MRRIAFVALLFLPAFSNAALISLVAQGTLTNYSDPDGLLPFSAPLSGTVFTITLSVDDSVPDASPGNASVGVYIDAITAMTLTFSGNQFSLANTVENDQLIFDDQFNDPSAQFEDRWEPTARFSTAGGIWETMGLSLVERSDTSPVTPLNSDASLPPLWPSVWDDAVIFYEIAGFENNQAVSFAKAEAAITSLTIVPVPAAIWLFPTGLIAGLSWMRRKAA